MSKNMLHISRFVNFQSRYLMFARCSIHARFPQIWQPRSCFWSIIEPHGRGKVISGVKTRPQNRHLPKSYLGKNDLSNHKFWCCYNFVLETIFLNANWKGNKCNGCCHGEKLWILDHWGRIRWTLVVEKFGTCIQSLKWEIQVGLFESYKSLI
jgi:hypothetical protein